MGGRGTFIGEAMHYIIRLDAREYERVLASCALMWVSGSLRGTVLMETLFGWFHARVR